MFRDTGKSWRRPESSRSKRRLCDGTFETAFGPTGMRNPFTPSSILVCLATVTWAAPVWADDAALRELQRNQQQRQQQQDALQLRMQQHQRSSQMPSLDARQEQGIRQLEINQRQRQQELHYRQNMNVPPPSPVDNEPARRAKAQIEQQRAGQESRRQLQRFDWEMEQARQRNGRD
jgi:hypothetical protein